MTNDRKQEKTVLHSFPASKFDSSENVLEPLWARGCFYDSMIISVFAIALENETSEDVSRLDEL